MNEELLKKAKKAKTAEELCSLAEENGITLSKEEAQEYFNSLSKNGDIRDDELDKVTGGGCEKVIDGKKYTVVTSGVRCFNGEYRKVQERETWLREKWYMYTGDGCCGDCANLILLKGIGYCGKSGR